MALILSIAGVAGLVSCTKETVRENTIVKERQADPSIRESITVDQETKSVKIKKTALAKAFLFVPTYRTSGRTPQWGDFKPVVVSFERSGSKIGLFKLTNDNVYDSIPSDKLLQSFNILREDTDSVQVDLSEGFKSLDISSSLELVFLENFGKQLANRSGGIESAIQVKDAVIREVKEENNTIRIEQVTRLVNEKREVGESEDEDEDATATVTKQESTMTFYFEIRPYVANPNFARPKLMDVEQRVGFFLNFAFKKGNTLPDPQIVRWDLSADRPPVTVALTKDIPEEAVSAVREGVEYWNRVLGRNVLKVQVGLDSKAAPMDRTIVVRWVPWDTAGFAYAGMQSDPLTGEAFRGQVFMTSSWYLYGKKSFQWPQEFAMKKSTLRGLSFVSSPLCVMKQSDFHFAEDLLQMSPANLQKVSLEIVRVVIAHEMGHVLGLRHNFAASSVFEGTDRDLLAKKQTYLGDVESGRSGKEITYPLASTVMDYHPAIETAMLGTYIKDQVLPYDVDALAWAYEGKVIATKKYDYCSDEHIMMAESASRTIYGCERFDSFKNPILGSVYEARRELMNLPLRPFMARLAALNSTNPYTNLRPLTEADVTFQLSASNLKDMFHTQAIKSPMVSIQAVIDHMVKGLAALPRATPFIIYGEDDKFGEQLQATSKEMGGLSEIIKWYLPPPEQKEKFAQAQVERFFELVVQNPETKLGAEELAQMKEIFMKAAVKFDRDNEVKILETFLPFVVNTVIDLKKPFDLENPPKKKISYYSTKLDLGNVKEVFERYRTAAVYRDTEVDAVAYGKNLKLKGLQNQNYQRRDLMKIFVPENWGTLQYTVAPQLTSEKEILKSDIAANGLALLLAANVELKPVTVAGLKQALEKLDWTQIKGVTLLDSVLQSEISMLETLEGQKKEEEK